VAQWQGRKGRPWRRVVEKLRELGRAYRLPCHLCGHPIDYDLPAEHPLSFTADHLVPRVAGGLPSLDNTAPAHRRCNSRKGGQADYVAPMPNSRAW
jgi:5-methylcytosine-specific restriction endonuclease McrA